MKLSKILLGVFAVSMLLLGCSSPTGPAGENSAKAITSFSFTSPAAATGTITGSAITVTLPWATSVTALVASFTTTGTSVKVGATVQTSGTTANDFSSPVTYTITAADGSTQNYAVTVTVASFYSEMIAVPAGSFNNGSSQVTLSAFHMSKYDITQSQYQAITGVNPSYFSGNADAATCPVEQVTWYDAVEFCNGLSSADGLQQVYTISGRTPATGYSITAATVTADFTKSGYRLPTEAQWEYAARAGTTTTYYWGNASDDPTLKKYAWYAANSGSATHSVGQKLPNAWGLYDMVGNVWQWCWDWYDTYPTEPQTDPTGPSSGTSRILRGGCWGNSSSRLRSANRGGNDPYNVDSGVGFRVVAP